MGRKRELAYVLNKYSRLYYGEGSMKYFPETYMLPEQLEEYKRVHKVVKCKLRNTKIEYTLVKLIEEVKEQE